MTMRGVCLLCSVALIAGCTTSFGKASLVSTQPVNVASAAAGRQVSGEDCARKVLLIPVSAGPSLSAAVDRALAPLRPGAMLVDAMVYNDYVITMLYNSNCLRVEGRAVEAPSRQP